MSKSKYLVSLAALPLAAGCVSSPEAAQAPTEQLIDATPTNAQASLDKQVCVRLKRLVFDFGYPDKKPVIEFFGDTNPDGTISIFGEDNSYSIAGAAKRINVLADTQTTTSPEAGAAIDTIAANAQQIRSLASKVMAHIPEVDGYPAVEQAKGYHELESLSGETRKLIISTVHDDCANPRIGY